MLKVLLIDDDILTINKLRTLINWEKEGFDLAGAACDGISGMKLMEQHRPDILILDVNMPKMDGIEVSAQVRERFPQCRVVILSNHDSFHYARDAMRNGAADYLLKQNMTPAFLKEKLAVLSRQIRQDTREKSRQQLFTKTAKAQYLRELVTGEPVSEEELAAISEMPEFKGVCCVACLHTAGMPVWNGDAQQAAHRQEQMVLQAADSIFSIVQKGMIVSLSPTEYAVLISFYQEVSQLKIREESEKVLRLLGSSLKKLMGDSVEISFEICPAGASGVQAAFQKACDKTEEKRLIPLCYDDFSARQNQWEIDVADEAGLVEAICRCDRQAVERIMEKILEEITSRPARRPGVIRALINISRRLCEKYTLPEKLSLLYTISSIADASPNQLRSLLKQHFSWLMEQAGKYLLKDYSEPVRQVIRYIQSNFGEDVTLSKMAAMTGRSETYLSKLFRRDTGSTFVEYLNNRRMTEAVRLLDQGVPLKDIYSRVGFGNYNYFIRVFREKTGMYPMEYKKTSMKNGPVPLSLKQEE